MTKRPSYEMGVGVGDIIADRYRLDAILGRGGMGCVYRAEHLGIGRTVAIKVLHTEISGNREAALRFQREALASGRLDHPNIVGVSDFGILDDGSCYLVMEALEGESLGTRIERGALPWREAIVIACGVLRGLAHAHDRGVVHRDIKPDNVFLATKEGVQVVKLLDFGIAKLFAGGADDPLTTRVGMTMGTPAYLSPEQAVGGTITPASDLYSASVVLFEMLAGRAPFEEPEAVAIMMAHVTRPAPTIEEVAPGVELPPGLAQVVHRGLEKIPEERIGSAADYARLLEEIVVATPPLAMHVVTPVPSLPSGLMPSVPAAARPERAVSIADRAPLPRGWISKAGMVIFAAIVLAIVLAFVSRRTEPTTSTIDARAPTAAEPTPSVVPPVSDENPRDRDSDLNAALHDLQSGKTCPERRAAIQKLVELNDARAIPPLKAARYRMRGGLLGIGQSNANACLKANAEAAIKELTKPP